MNYTPKEMALAHEIANALNDRHSLPQHLKFARHYKEEELRETLKRAMITKEEDLTKSRGALFTSLLRNYYGYRG